MLEKHKNLIKNKLDNKEYEVSDSILRIKIILRTKGGVMDSRKNYMQTI